MQREPIDYPADALPTRDDHVRTADGWTLPVTVTSPGLGAHGAVLAQPRADGARLPGHVPV